MDRSAEPGRHRLPVLEDSLFHHTELPATRLSNGLDNLLLGIGSLVSWLWVVLVAIILTSVIYRYVFSGGTVAIEELQWQIAGIAWLTGLSYALISDHHVRVDILHEKFGLKTQAWIELLGILVLLLPFLVIGIAEGIPYFWSSFLLNERSQAPGGLPYRWILKLVVPVTLVLLALAAVSRLLKCTALLFGLPRPLPPSDARNWHG